MRPNVRGGLFDRVYVPAHDSCKYSDAVRINGAITYISRNNKTVAKNKFLTHYNLSVDFPFTISFFIGAPLAQRAYDQSIAENMFLSLDEYCAENNFGLLVTTSPRTPEDIRALAEKCFKHAALIIDPDKNNTYFAASGMIISADAVFCTSDSISMMSEAAEQKPLIISDIFNVRRFSEKHCKYCVSMASNGNAFLLDHNKVITENVINEVIKKVHLLKTTDNFSIINDSLNFL